MEKEQDTTLQDAEEHRRQKHDADNGNDGSSNALLQKENLIDPGNEHHHSENKDKNLNKPRNDADSSNDATGTKRPGT